LDKKTPFHSFHKEHNAKLISFSGYEMPIQYKGINFEHNHVRNSVGVFDVSHMAQILINGNNAFDLVQKITTNDISKLVDGKVQYSCMLNQDGGIIDDLLVYQIKVNSYMLVVNAANTKKDFDWICLNNTFGLEVVNVTEDRGLLAIQGPKANMILQRLTNIDLNNISYYSFKIGEFAGCQDIIISNTGYTGSGGFELYLDKKFASKIWKSLFINNDILEPIGLAARDTLRLEMGYCLYGNDINESRSPVEAGLSWIVNMKKDFVGKKIIANHIRFGVNEKLVGFLMEEKGVPRKDYNILNESGENIGVVTSGTLSPLLKIGLGMGYVLTDFANVNSIIFIVIRGKKIKAKIVKTPFYEK
tara:strand:+ start:1280 stop:2359 length:1080 start_codon:yes stop_codon:yes gene_type:complete